VTAVWGSGGIRIEDAEDTVVIRHAIVSECEKVGILVSHSTATIETSTILPTKPGAEGIADGIVVRRRKNAAGHYAVKAEAQIKGAIVRFIPIQSAETSGSAC